MIFLFWMGVIFNFPSRPFWKTTWCFGKIPGPTPRALPTTVTPHGAAVHLGVLKQVRPNHLSGGLFLWDEKVQKKKPAIIIISAVVAVFFWKVRFLLGTLLFFFVRILFHHLVHREFHQSLHKMLKIHICPICQDSVAFHVFFLSSPNGLSRFVRDPARRFFWGVFQLFSSILMDPSIRRFKGWDVARVRTNLQRMDCIRQVGIGKSKKKLTTKIHARLRLLYFKKKHNECSGFSPPLELHRCWPATWH